MSMNKKSIKKILPAAAALLLFSAAQANAGSVTLNGVVDHINEVWPLATTTETSISVAIAWDDTLVSSDPGIVSEVTLSGGSNTLSFTMGSFAFNQFDIPVDGFSIAKAHFTAGTFDGLFLEFSTPMTTSFEGQSGTWYTTAFWNYNGSFGYYDGETNEIWISDDDSFGEVTAYFTTPPAAAPVPVPASVFLFGSGLLSLVGLSRRQKHHNQ